MSQNIKSHHDKFKRDSKKTLYSQFAYSKKKKKEEDTETLMESISDRIGLPGDILAGAPIVSIYGRSELVIENYKNIIEYNGNLIKVQTKLCRVLVEGVNLNINYFTNDEMKITGNIHAIHYK